MSHFVRPVDHDIVDLFVQKAEGGRYCRDQFLEKSPYLLGNRELKRLFAYLPEKSSDGLIVTEASGHRKHVVLKAAEGGGSYLSCEACALAFPEAEVCLAIFEHDFQTPSSGVDFPCLEELHFGVRGKQAVPFAMGGASYKKDSNLDSTENGVKHDIVALEASAVFPQSELLAFLYKGRSREVAVFRMILCLSALADLYHPEPVALGVKAVDEPDYLLVGEPAVGQNIPELDFVFDGSLDHLLEKLNLALVIFLFPGFEGLAGSFGHMAPFAFLGAHAVISGFAFLSEYGEIKKHLRDAVGHGNAETFEAKHGLMAKMGMHAPDFLYGAPRFLMVCVIDNKTRAISLMVGTDVDLRPKLRGYLPHGVAPVYVGVLHKSVEHVFSGFDEGRHGGVLPLAPYVADAETREEEHALENSHETVDAVLLALHAQSAFLRHFYAGEKARKGMHGFGHVRIFEKFIDFREKRSNFVYRHGLEYVFLVVLKITHFLPIRQETMSFFYVLISRNRYLRNLNSIIILKVFA